MEILKEVSHWFECMVHPEVGGGGVEGEVSSIQTWATFMVT